MCSIYLDYEPMWFKRKKPRRHEESTKTAVLISAIDQFASVEEPMILLWFKTMPVFPSFLNFKPNISLLSEIPVAISTTAS